MLHNFFGFIQECSNNLLVFTITSLAGMIKYLLGLNYEVEIMNIQWLTIFTRVGESVLVAALCGFVGVFATSFGKFVLSKFKKFLKSKKIIK